MPIRMVSVIIIKLMAVLTGVDGEMVLLLQHPEEEAWLPARAEE